MPSAITNSRLETHSPPSYSPGVNALGLNAEYPLPEAPKVFVSLLEPPPRHRSKSRSRSRKPSASRATPSRRAKSPHRTPLSIAQAFVEEHRQAGEVSALEARLSAETRRAEDAIARAEYAERREKETLTTVARLEAQRQKSDEETVAIESSSRNYQVQLELTERELRVARRDGELLQEEYRQLERSYKHVQEQGRKYQNALKESHARMDSRETVMQTNMKKWFTNGEGVGYDNGYQDGYEEGKRDGKRQGIKAGRKEGLREGIAQGRAEERRNALDAIDQFLAVDGYNGDDPVGVRRWAQSVYYPHSQRPSTDIGSNPVAP